MYKGSHNVSDMSYLNSFPPSTYFFEAVVNGIVFLIFFLTVFIVGVQKSYLYLHIDFVSCYFAESVYDIKEFLWRFLESLGI
jgi:hypothetical protein